MKEKLRKLNQIILKIFSAITKCKAESTIVSKELQLGCNLAFTASKKIANNMPIQKMLHRIHVVNRETRRPFRILFHYSKFVKYKSDIQDMSFKRYVKITAVLRRRGLSHECALLL